MKHCKKCNETKSVDEFHRDKRAASGRTSYCKECQKAKSRANYKANPERAREYERNRRQSDPDRDRRINYRRKYGITLDEYNAMLLAQSGVCAVCQQPERRAETLNLAVDHDHETGKVRGLLCSNCNRALGLLADDPKRIIALAEYLTRQGEQTK